MSFSHVQGIGGTGSATTSLSVTLPANPTAGNPVIVVLGSSVAITSVSVKDQNNNVYTITPNSPQTTGTKQIYLAYLLSAPSNANKVINATWTTSAKRNLNCR